MLKQKKIFNHPKDSQILKMYYQTTGSRSGGRLRYLSLRCLPKHQKGTMHYSYVYIFGVFVNRSR